MENFIKLKINIMDHKNLDAWKKSIDLVKQCYSQTSNFPDEEKFGIISQINRAAVSVPTNIAEGAARNHDKEFIQFLYISLGSLAELETLFIISKELEFLHEDNFNVLIENMETSKKLVLGLIKYLKAKQ
jgi:four helix bundle protein